MGKENEYENENDDSVQKQIDDLTEIVSEYEKLFKQQETKIGELEAQQSQIRPTQYTPQTHEELKKFWDEKFIEDPSTTVGLFVQNAVDQAFSRYAGEVDRKIRPTVEKYKEDARNVVRRAREDYGELEEDIEAILKTLPEGALVPDAVDAAYLVAKGYKEFGDYRTAFVEGASGYTEEGGEEDIKLTPAQQKVSERFGISTDEYKKRLKMYERRRSSK